LVYPDGIIWVDGGGKVGVKRKGWEARVVYTETRKDYSTKP
jgi:hypothetical protein